jgi:predicted nucleotidyltransferase
VQDGLRFDFASSSFQYPRDIIHAFIGGSELHGAKLEGTDDHDIYGVFIEPPENILGLDAQEHYVWSTAGTERRNGPQDIDVVLYGLQKWAKLACKGNPSVLHFLFAPNLAGDDCRTEAWERVLEKKRLFLARSHCQQYVGYANAQLRKMLGERSRNVRRPELVEEYGFDTKFAMHTIRLMVECRELLTTGNVTLPCVEKDLLIAIRKGEVDQEWIISETEARIADCEGLAESTTVLPATIDRAAVSEFIAEIYREHWDARGSE